MGDLYVLWPLAQRLRLWVNTTFAPLEVRDLAAALLQERSELCGQTVLVSWNHCAIPALAQALGCKDPACLACWDDRDFDTLFWLRFDRDAKGAEWRLDFHVEHEGFGQFQVPSGYGECSENPSDSVNFGFPARGRGSLS